MYTTNIIRMAEPLIQESYKDKKCVPKRYRRGRFELPLLTNSFFRFISAYFNAIKQLVNRQSPEKAVSGHDKYHKKWTDHRQDRGQVKKPHYNTSKGRTSKNSLFLK